REAGTSGGNGPAPPPRLARRDGAGDEASEGSGKSEDELVAEALSSAIGDALRKPLAGEERVRGTLTRVECGAKGIVFVIKVGERLLRLSAKGFDELHIMAFTNEAGSELSCGPRKLDSPVVVTYRAAADARAKTDGPLVALEFVPASFQLKQ
ncbi:MAG: hypothetical protein H7Z38_03285, partial [Rubrivivax sp.]|nr:hypothetical protein [Pyrinomonadaceae bacterium]